MSKLQSYENKSSKKQTFIGSIDRVTADDIWLDNSEKNARILKEVTSRMMRHPNHQMPTLNPIQNQLKLLTNITSAETMR